MTDSRLALIRFVTSRHGDLQGLHNAAFAISILIIMALTLWVRPGPKVLGELVVFAAWVVLSEGAPRLVHWWYASRYGRVNGAIPGLTRPTTASMLMGLGAAGDLTPLFPMANHSAFVILLAAYGAWVAYRDFSWRAYHLALVALPGIAPAVPQGAPLLGYFPPYAAALAGLAVMGLLDHHLLRTLIDRVQSERHPQRVSNSDASQLL